MYGEVGMLGMFLRDGACTSEVRPQGDLIAGGDARSPEVTGFHTLSRGFVGRSIVRAHRHFEDTETAGVVLRKLKFMSGRVGLIRAVGSTGSTLDTTEAPICTRLNINKQPPG